MHPRDWISSLLLTSSSKILINGGPGKNIKHAGGLRQGDPLSPLLFILAIDPLQCIIEMAAERGFLQPILPKTAKLRCSLYADDAAIFSAPTANDLSRLSRILHIFGECSGLTINMGKTEIFPIRLDTSTVQTLLQNFPGKISSFPGKYLGLPLHTRKLRRVEIQPLIDKIGSRQDSIVCSIAILKFQQYPRSVRCCNPKETKCDLNHSTSSWP